MRRAVALRVHDCAVTAAPGKRWNKAGHWSPGPSPIQVSRRKSTDDGKVVALLKEHPIFKNVG